MGGRITQRIKPHFKFIAAASLMMFVGARTNGQTITGDNYREIAKPDTSAEFKPHGRLWGCAFGDYAFKSNADNLGRGGSNMYSGMAANNSLFQFRRVYLGYDYDINKRFTAVFLLSAESDWQAGLMGQPAGSNGDLLINNKFAPFVKQAYLRWKDIWKGTDLVVGQQNTAAYGITGRDKQTPEELWGYRSIERTVSDIYGTPCYDMGASLQGWFDANGNYGYDVMIGNGTGARPEGDAYKWMYGNVYAKFFDKKVVINLYQDYQRMNWGVYTTRPNNTWYHDRNMTKLAVAYTTRKLTVGFEGFRNTILGDLKVTTDGSSYYRTSKALAMSFYVRGRILSTPAGDPKLGFFARYDNYDPKGDLSAIVDEANVKSYTATTAAYDPTTKQQLILLGLDYSPTKNVHVMPNLWMNTYQSTLAPTAANAALNPMISGSKGTDVVWRLTFFWMYGR